MFLQKLLCKYSLTNLSHYLYIYIVVNLIFEIFVDYYLIIIYFLNEKTTKDYFIILFIQQYNQKKLFIVQI